MSTSRCFFLLAVLSGCSGGKPNSSADTSNTCLEDGANKALTEFIEQASNLVGSCKPTRWASSTCIMIIQAEDKAPATSISLQCTSSMINGKCKRGCSAW